MKKAILAASLLILAACGDSTPKIDGASNAMAQRSLDKMINTMPDGESIRWQNDVAMLKSRYSEGDQFAKRFGGKTLEELKPDIADTKTYFIKWNRDRHAAVEQKEIDELQVKLSGFESSPESNIKYVMISQTKSRIEMYTKSRDAILALSDDQAWAEFGCGCEQSKFKSSGTF